MRRHPGEGEAEVVVLAAFGPRGIIASSFSTRSYTAAFSWLEEILERRRLRALRIGEVTNLYWREPRRLVVELDLTGLTRFRIRLYLWLVEHVHPGTVVTYGEVASALGTSPRAVGRALAANPFPPIVPCHRVLAKGGLGGFSGPIREKEALLRIERVLTSSPAWRRVA